MTILVSQKWVYWIWLNRHSDNPHAFLISSFFLVANRTIQYQDMELYLTIPQKKLDILMQI